MGAPISDERPTDRRVAASLLILGPLGFALFAFLSFHVANLGHPIAARTLVVLVVFSLGVALVGVAVSYAVYRDLRKASVLSVFGVVVFFSFGHVKPLAGRLPLVDRIGAGWFVAAATALVGVLLALKIRSLSVQNSTRLTMILVGTAGVLVAMPLIAIARWHFGGSTTASRAAAPEAKGREDLPDIYYILLDGYARADVLRDTLGFDNSSFVDALRRRGFFVADKSRANYAHTILSVPSMLNMRYIEEGGDEDPNRIVREMIGLIDDNLVVRRLRSIGYRFAPVGSGWYVMERSRLADIDSAPASRSLSFGEADLELDDASIAYLGNTMLWPAISSRVSRDRRDVVLHAFDTVEELADRKESTFAMVHIFSPHPPFLFDAEGRWVNRDPLANAWTDRDGYIAQLRFVNRRTIEMVDRILERSKRPPIIVIASDHGSTISSGDPKGWGDPSAVGDEGLRERLGILNAFSFPDGKYHLLYDGITPVNTFQVIFKQYFGYDDEPLPDRSYYSSSDELTRFHLIPADVINGRASRDIADAPAAK